MSIEQKQLTEFAIQDLIGEIVRHEGLAMEVAMDKLYHSDFLAKLNNPATGLYLESGGYLYAMFANVPRASDTDGSRQGAVVL